jgi:hypothetical protein
MKHAHTFTVEVTDRDRRGWVRMIGPFYTRTKAVGFAEAWAKTAAGREGNVLAVHSPEELAADPELRITIER